ncbi:CopG family ribbon-helix-helix protein [Halomonas jincaotanensis]|uniref:CopG family ribbon-helix-helix protein n=1 Tax=Halomonas jincaotanensis TaxID=2810616 RepID=UPI00202305AA|nr:ribbon-helix-helix protein, CopG family [Halomonas jincaotanensis]
MHEDICLSTYMSAFGRYQLKMKEPRNAPSQGSLEAMFSVMDSRNSFDDDLKGRVQHLADARRRSAHWLMRECFRPRDPAAAD